MIEQTACGRKAAEKIVWPSRATHPKPTLSPLFSVFLISFFYYPLPFFLDFPSVALAINWQTVSACSMCHSTYFNPNLQLTQERRRRGWEMEKEREKISNDVLSLRVYVHL